MYMIASCQVGYLQCLSLKKITVGRTFPASIKVKKERDSVKRNLLVRQECLTYQYEIETLRGYYCFSIVSEKAGDMLA